MNCLLVIATMLIFNIVAAELDQTEKLFRYPRQFDVNDRYGNNFFNQRRNRVNRQFSWNQQPNFNTDPFNNQPYQNWRDDNDIPFVFELPSGRQTQTQRPRPQQQQQNFPNPSTTRRPPVTATPAVPGMGTTRSPCEDACQITPQYNPICGDNGLTYFNQERYNCARRCGIPVQIRHLGACTRLPGTPVN